MRLRSYAELGIPRYKRVFGGGMKARVAATKDHDMGQCVRAEYRDQSGHAGVSPRKSEESREMRSLQPKFDLFNNAHPMHESALIDPAVTVIGVDFGQSLLSFTLRVNIVMQ